MDAAIAVSDDHEAEAVVAALTSRGWSVAALVEQDAAGRLATARLTPSGRDVGAVLDVLFASSGIEAEVVGAAETLEVLPDLHVPVARPGHLVALKLLARDDERRPQDLADLRALRSVLDSCEVRRAREAVALIQRRGYARDRDLVAALDSLLAT